MMVKIKDVSFCICIICLLLMAGCKTLKPTPLSGPEKMPPGFSSREDTLNSADAGWSHFFADSNLLALVEVAVQNNLDVKMALQKTNAAGAAIAYRRGALLPNVSLQATAAQRKFGLYTMDGAGNISTEITPGQIVPIHLPDYYVGLQTAWEIDIWGKLRDHKKAALSRYLATIEGRNLVLTDLVANIASAYYELVALDNQLTIIRETIQLQDNAFEMVKVQKEAGRANELAVKQLQAQVLNSKSLEVELRQKITEFETLINFLSGRYPQPIPRNRQVFSNELPAAVHTGVPSDLLSNRPDIRQAEYELVASKADLKAAKAAFYPSLSIAGGIGYQAFKTNFLFTSPESMAYSLIGNLAAPLVNRSAIKAAFKTADAGQQQAMFNYQKSIVNAYAEVYNEVNRIKNLEELYTFKSSEVQILTEAIESSDNLFKTGRANYLEVLTMQHNALSSRLELVEVRKRQYQAMVTIYKALGGGWR